MNTSSKLILGIGTACLAVAAHAQVSPYPAPSTGGDTGATGTTGAIESAPQPRKPARAMSRRSEPNISRYPGSEASTMVNGQPNGNPDAPNLGTAGSIPSEAQTMGGAADVPPQQGSATRNQHRSWGTPD
jgi:hypothetical protein